MNNYIPISVAQLNKYYAEKLRMKALFQKIETRFINKFGRDKKPFINYRFMIEVFLTNFEFLECKQYVKQIKCAKRYQRNVTILNSMNIKLGDKDLIVPDSLEVS